MADDHDKFGLLVLVILVTIVGIGLQQKFLPAAFDKESSSIVETRREHLVFHAEGCRVFQVRIEDEDGLRHIYVSVPHPDKHGRLTTPYPRCQVTAH